MKLYKIIGATRKEAYFSQTEFITAEKPSIAISKFTEIHADCKYIEAVMICRRDEIIPTIEPMQEKS